MKDWTLEDIENTNRLYPDSFYIPSAKKRNNQKIGDIVKLHFILCHQEGDSPRAERMWVEITGRKLSSKKYLGILTNQPLYINSLNAGEIIEFEPKNIASVFIKEGDPNWLEIGEEKALVSNKCLEAGWTIRWLYREQTDRNDDSGWRLFEGTETEEYNNDPSNIKIFDVYYLCEKDPTLISIFKNDYGAAFEREDKNSPWIEVKDWHFE